MKTRSIAPKKDGRDLAKATRLIKAAFNIVHEQSPEAYRAGRAALTEAFGHKYIVHRDDLLRILLASAISFSNEA